jgi:hypothetical protein
MDQEVIIFMDNFCSEDGCQRMEGQSKKPRSLEACCRRGQGLPRAVAPFGRKKGILVLKWVVPDEGTKFTVLLVLISESLH